MRSIFQRIIVESVRRKLRNERGEQKSSFSQMKSVYTAAKVEWSFFWKSAMFMLLGVLSASFGLKGFLLPNGFIDGGVTGMSLITAEISPLPFPLLLVLINLPFLLLAWISVSRNFALRSFTAIVLLALATLLIPFPTITADKLLISVFGGFFLGLGIGLAIRGSAVLDGTEVLAVFISRKTPMTIGDVILIFNILIFSAGALVFNIEIALYAVLTYLVASKTVDFVVDGIEEYLGVTIISEKSEEIRLAIIENLGRGCTIYQGKKGYAKRGEILKETDIVYTLITRLEMSKLQAEVDKIDKDAFMVMHSIKDARGGMIKKRPHKQLKK